MKRCALRSYDEPESDVLCCLAERRHDLAVDIQPTQGEPASAVKIAAVVAQGNPDVIVTVGEHEARAASSAAPRIPVVFTKIGDPVAVGLVVSLAHPGGQLTGISDLIVDLVPKRL